MPNAKSIFSLKMYDEERHYENISNLDADALYKAYLLSEKPFVEMAQYGKLISEAEFAQIQQRNMMFSVEFDADRGEAIISSDGEHFENRPIENVHRHAHDNSSFTARSKRTSESGICERTETNIRLLTVGRKCTLAGKKAFPVK